MTMSPKAVDTARRTLLSALKALLDTLDEAGPTINHPAAGLPDGSGLQL